MKIKLFLIVPIFFFSFSTAHLATPKIKKVAEIKSEFIATNKDITCLAKNIYMEARGEPIDGQIAVATVTLNRVKSPLFPDNVCDVVYQKAQFSWTLKQNPQPITDVESWERAIRVAKFTVKTYYKLDNKITHFHTKKVKPKWRKYFTELKVIGNHVFYG